jgi:hypothetical protein
MKEDYLHQEVEEEVKEEVKKKPAAKKEKKNPAELNKGTKRVDR